MVTHWISLSRWYTPKRRELLRRPSGAWGVGAGLGGTWGMYHTSFFWLQLVSRPKRARCTGLVGLQSDKEYLCHSHMTKENVTDTRIYRCKSRKMYKDTDSDIAKNAATFSGQNMRRILAMFGFS